MSGSLKVCYGGPAYSYDFVIAVRMLDCKIAKDQVYQWFLDSLADTNQWLALLDEMDNLRVQVLLCRAVEKNLFRFYIHVDPPRCHFWHSSGMSILGDVDNDPQAGRVKTDFFVQKFKLMEGRDSMSQISVIAVSSRVMLEEMQQLSNLLTNSHFTNTDAAIHLGTTTTSSDGVQRSTTMRVQTGTNMPFQTNMNVQTNVPTQTWGGAQHPALPVGAVDPCTVVDWSRQENCFVYTYTQGQWNKTPFRL